jgi:hypothetical protein
VCRVVPYRLWITCGKHPWRPGLVGILWGRKPPAKGPFICISERSHPGRSSPFPAADGSQRTAALLLVYVRKVWRTCFRRLRAAVLAEEPPDLPAGGQKQDLIAITERDRIRQSTQRNAAPNAEYSLVVTGLVSLRTAYRSSCSGVVLPDFRRTGNGVQLGGYARPSQEPSRPPAKVGTQPERR